MTPAACRQDSPPEQDVGDGVAGLDARGNHASRIAGDEAATFVSVSGRPLNSTTTNGLPVALIASISSCCLPGRSISLRAADSPLWPRVSPSASTTC
jgi:hypothetical protein